MPRLEMKAAARNIMQQLLFMEEQCVTAHERALIRAALNESEQSSVALEAAIKQRTSWAVG